MCNPVIESHRLTSRECMFLSSQMLANGRFHYCYLLFPFSTYCAYRYVQYLTSLSTSPCWLTVYWYRWLHIYYC